MEAAKPVSCESELPNQVLTVFQQFDINRDGCIDRNELKQVMQTLDPVLWSDRRTCKLLQSLDRNRDGRLQYQEFVQWACSEDTSQEMKLFREALHISREEGQAAPKTLPRSRHPSPSCPHIGPERNRSRAIPRCSSRSTSRERHDVHVARPSLPTIATGQQGCSGNRACSKGSFSEGRRPASRARASSVRGAAPRTSSAPRPRAKSKGYACTMSLPRPEVKPAESELLLGLELKPEAAPKLVEESSLDVEVCTQDPRCNATSERLIIFDYDGTITIDKDQTFKGFTALRLARLKSMMAKIRKSEARCILVTAQFPAATQDITIPALRRTGLSGLFEDESLDSRLQLYWDDAAHGTIYNGAKVMMGKIGLIQKIIAGENCWGRTFSPSNVLFIDDVARNFQGNEKVGIQIRHVEQDGMVDEDMDIVEAFAEGR